MFLSIYGQLLYLYMILSGFISQVSCAYIFLTAVLFCCCSHVHHTFNIIYIMNVYFLFVKCISFIHELYIFSFFYHFHDKLFYCIIQCLLLNIRTKLCVFLCNIQQKNIKHNAYTFLVTFIYIFFCKQHFRAKVIFTVSLDKFYV